MIVRTNLVFVALVGMAAAGLMAGCGDEFKVSNQDTSPGETTGSDTVSDTGSATETASETASESTPTETETQSAPPASDSETAVQVDALLIEPRETTIVPSGTVELVVTFVDTALQPVSLPATEDVTWVLAGKGAIEGTPVAAAGPERRAVFTASAEAGRTQVSARYGTAQAIAWINVALAANDTAKQPAPVPQLGTDSFTIKARK